MCLWCTSQVVSKEHSAEARGEWAREGGKVTSTGHTADQYWSLMSTSTGRCSDQYYFIFLFGEQRAASVIFLFGEQRAASVAIGLCDSGLSSAAKAS